MLTFSLLDPILDCSPMPKKKRESEPEIIEIDPEPINHGLPLFLDSLTYPHHHNSQNQSLSSASSSVLSTPQTTTPSRTVENPIPISEHISRNTFLTFGHGRVRPFTNCNTVKMLFTQAEASDLITESTPHDLLILKFVNDGSASIVKIVRNDVGDFRTLTDLISRSRVWGTGLLTEESGQKLLLEVTLMARSEDHVAGEPSLELTTAC